MSTKIIVTTESDTKVITTAGAQGPAGKSGAIIDDSAGIGDTDVTWSADKSARELDAKVDKVIGLGLSELSFTTADKTSLDQSEQDRHTHSNKPVIDDLSDDAGVLQYKGAPISDQAALDAKVDKVAGKSLVSDLEIAKLSTVQENATANRDDSENADKVHGHTIEQVTGLDTTLETKVDKFEGYSLVADDEIDKLSTVEQYAQKNTVSSVAGKQGDVLLDKEDVGLSEVDNTADTDKPVSSAVAVALADKVDAVAGKQLSDENYTLDEKDKLGGIAEQATKNRADSENADKVHTHTTAQVTGLDTTLAGKVDKQAGKGLSDTNFTQAEKTKLSSVATGATANRPDSENADKIHEHVIADVTGLDDALLAKFDKVNIAQNTGTATDKVMSQKAVTELINSISSYIPTPKPTPDSFGAPFEGGFYTGMIWNHIALSTENKTLTTGIVTFHVNKSNAIVYKGQSLEVRSISNPDNKFIGTVAGAGSGYIVLNVTSISGSGTFSDWAVMSRFRVITAPKAQGESVPLALKFENTYMPTATQTLTEGWEATNAMVAAGTDTEYPAAHWARALNINGYTDWYIPARDELELVWRNLKPQALDNYIGSRYASPINYRKDGAYPDSAFTQGVNLNSSPQSPAYTLTDPAQTDALAFRVGGSEEFMLGFFWSSSEVNATSAWGQYWLASNLGHQYNLDKSNLRRFRAVRRSII